MQMSVGALKTKLTLWKWLGVKIANIGYIGQMKKDVLVIYTIFAHIEMTFAVTENGNKRTILRSERERLERY